MRVLIVAACLLLLALTAFADVPSNLVVTRDGYDWVWAAPCSPVEPSCNASGHGLTMQYGFSLPTVGEWTASFTDTADIYGAFTLGGRAQLCASSYFDSGYSHCDSSDVQAGYIWGAPVGIANAFGGDTNGLSEAFLVRGAAAVPEPSSLILLFSVGVATVIAWRRRG